LPDKQSGEIPVAFIKPKEGVTIDPEEVRQYLKNTLQISKSQGTYTLKMTFR